jgi:hypothetical protein
LPRCWENGYVESFHGKFRDELLNRELLDTLWEAQILVEGWRKEYNMVRPHSAPSLSTAGTGGDDNKGVAFVRNWIR